MFREMRRQDRSVTLERAFEILKEADYGTLTLFGDDGYPYGVPVNHVVVDNAIYFHAATEGKKLDSIHKNNRVGFTAVAYDELVPEKLSTKYASVIVMGTASIADDSEKRKALVEIMKRFAPDYMKLGEKSSNSSFGRTAIIKITIDHITGKENKR